MNRINLVPFAMILLAATAGTGCDSDGPCPTEGAVRGAEGCACPEGTRFEHVGNDPGACVPLSGGADVGNERDASLGVSVADAGGGGARSPTDSGRSERDPSGSERDSGGSERDPIEGERDAGGSEVDAHSENAQDAAANEQTETERDAATGFDPDSGRIVDSGPSCAPKMEVCDGVDNDCDEQIDESVMKTWYPDCDQDGFAPMVPGTTGCLAPSATAGCAWTTRTPTLADNDCDDNNALRHPGADFGLPAMKVGEELPPAGDSNYDLNCDGSLELDDAAYLVFTVGSGASPQTLEIASAPRLVSLCEEGAMGCCITEFRAFESLCGGSLGVSIICNMASVSTEETMAWYRCR